MKRYSMAQEDFLVNPEIFEVNSIEAHSDHTYYRNLEEVQDNNQSTFRYSLNGMWQFNFAKNPAQRVKEFYEVDYDTTGWDMIKVPGHIQLQGYDKPHYVNTMYPWDGHNNIVPPHIPEDYNPVGSYVKYFTVPDNLKKSPVFICFEGVESAFYLWINGKFVGYSEDSFTPREFDVTDFICEGENKIAVEVYKWCSGSWLEDQDFWRLSGIFRDVYLYTIPEVHIQDTFIKTDLNEEYKKGTLSNTLSLKYSTKKPITIEMQLFDVENQLISKTEEITTEEDAIKLELEINGPKLWSAEEPYLYTSYLFIKDALTQELIEIVPQKVGFRKFEMINKIMHLNGKRIVFKGVNRHEFSCYNGRAVTKEEMLWDIKFLKQNHFNAVRTSHYPNNSYWYELCDIYGIYVIDEANLESHGTWQKMGAVKPDFVVPDDKPEWLGNILDRAKSMLERDKNHPSILIWSCGNESFGGENIYKMSEYFRTRDNTRLVHYEGTFHDRRFDNTSDMESRMYAKVEEIEAYLDNNPQKPFTLCEYTHAMGNSNGGLHKYSELEAKYPMYQGGFIWDYIDQGIMTKDRYGKEYLAFGGDFGDRPTDYNFCVNGIVYADRKPSPKMQEVKFLFQDFKIYPDLKGALIKNESSFTNTNRFNLQWQVNQEGSSVESGQCMVDIEPLAEKYITLPITKVVGEGEYTIDVKLVLKEDTLWAQRGHEIAFGQSVHNLQKQPIKDTTPIRVEDCDVNIGVKGTGFQAIFSKQSGTLVSLKYGNKEMLDAGPMPNFWRAPTDNDRGNSMPQKSGQWKLASLYAKHTDIALEYHEHSASITYTYDLHTVPKEACKVRYEVFGNGAIDVTMTYEGQAGLKEMPVYGMSFKIPADYENIEWYGNGPGESYSDRKCGARLGIFQNKVVDNVSEYVIPQECGNKTDVRWAKITDNTKVGLKISGEVAFEISALPYTCHELENAYHHYNLPPIHHTVINVAKMQKGVGGDDSWGAPVHEAYCIPDNQKLLFKFRIENTLE